MENTSLIDNVKPVPSASASGKQEGRESPKQRKQRMIEYLKSGRPPVPDEVLAFEKANGISVPDKSAVKESDQDQSGKEKPARKRREPKPVEIQKPARKKIVVSIEIEGVGTYRTPVYNIVDANYGIFVVFPNGTEDTVFIPSVGTEITISVPGEKPASYRCYYPGVVAEIPGLDACVMAFIKAFENV